MAKAARGVFRRPRPSPLLVSLCRACLLDAARVTGVRAPGPLSRGTALRAPDSDADGLSAVWYSARCSIAPARESQQRSAQPEIGEADEADERTRGRSLRSTLVADPASENHERLAAAFTRTLQRSHSDRDQLSCVSRELSPLFCRFLARRAPPSFLPPAAAVWMGGQQSSLVPLARHALLAAAKRDLASFSRRHPELTVSAADLVDFNYISSVECTGTIRFRVHRSNDAVSSVDEPTDPPPDDDALRLWFYVCTPLRDSADGEWVAQRVESEDVMARRKAKQGQTNKKTNKVATL